MCWKMLCVPRSPGAIPGKGQLSYHWKKYSCSSLGRTLLTCNTASSLCLGKVLTLYQDCRPVVAGCCEPTRGSSGSWWHLQLWQEITKEPFNIEPGGVITNCAALSMVSRTKTSMGNTSGWCSWVLCCLVRRGSHEEMSAFHCEHRGYPSQFVTQVVLAAIQSQ